MKIRPAVIIGLAGVKNNVSGNFQPAFRQNIIRQGFLSGHKVTRERVHRWVPGFYYQAGQQAAIKKLTS